MEHRPLRLGVMMGALAPGTLCGLADGVAIRTWGDVGQSARRWMLQDVVEDVERGPFMRADPYRGLRLSVPQSLLLRMDEPVMGALSLDDVVSLRDGRVEQRAGWGNWLSPLGGRNGAAMQLDEGLRLEGGFALIDPRNPASLSGFSKRSGVLENGGGVTVEHYDVSMDFEAARIGPLRLSAITGIRMTTADLRETGAGPSRPFPAMDSVPVAGGAVRWVMDEGWTLEGSAVARSARADSSLLELGVGSRWRVSASADLSIEYRFVRNRFEAEPFGGELRRDGLTVELRLGF